MTCRSASKLRLPRPAPSEGGYALVAAVMVIAIFAYVAMAVMSAGRGGMAEVAGRLEKAKLEAAADGGLFIAIHGLATDNAAERWSIDSRERTESVEDVVLTIVVEDERGKVPLNGLNDAQAHALFRGGGAAGPRLEALVAEYRAWETNEAPFSSGSPASTGLPVQNEPEAQPTRRGPFVTVGELSMLPDMTGEMLARIAPVVTLFFGESGPFDYRDATPLAAAAMSARTEGVAPPPMLSDPADAQSADQDALRRDDRYYGRAVTVRVTARAPDGARTHRMAIIELTGDRTRPYWVRYVE